MDQCIVLLSNHQECQSHFFAWTIYSWAAGMAHALVIMLHCYCLSYVILTDTLGFYVLTEWPPWPWTLPWCSMGRSVLLLGAKCQTCQTITNPRQCLLWDMDGVARLDFWSLGLSRVFCSCVIFCVLILPLHLIICGIIIDNIFFAQTDRSWKWFDNPKYSILLYE